MGVDFKITQERTAAKPNIVVFHLSGWLDAQSEARLVESVQKAKDEGIEFVLLDLTNLDTITSAGIRSIQKAYALLTPRGQSPTPGRLKLCCAPPQIYQVLKLTGLLASVPVYESADTAIDSFGS
jgi:stage II sporulation protein AA (anti-sigma F factor antagonist)